jgi:hypothetical protein
VSSNAADNATPLFGLAAEFESPESLAAAAHGIASAGYRSAEVYTPFAVEGLPAELGVRRTWMAPIVGVAALTGACTGFAMQWFANVIHYPWIVGGKPANSWPMWIPITFECAILFGVVSGVTSMLLLNGLPRLYHPMFRLPAFSRASRDRFFLCVEASDPKFDLAETRRLLETFAPSSLMEVPR